MTGLSFKSLSLAVLSGLVPWVAALGQKPIVSFESSDGAFQIVGGDVGTGQIRVSGNDYWGVIRAAGDLAADFGRATGTNFTLSNGKSGASPAKYTFRPVDVSDNTVFKTLDEDSFSGPEYADPDPENTVIIAGTIGTSGIIDQLIEAGSIDVSEVEGQWEAFVSQLVENPMDGVARALVIAGSDPRGTIFGLYDVSEQIGVSPWYFWADVPTRQAESIYVLPDRKVQKSPSVKYRGIFINDEQPGLSSWVATQWNNTWNDAAPYNHEFYALVSELLLRLRANYLWPALWGNMVYVDDPLNQPLLDAYEMVLGGSHTEPMMRAQNEFGSFYDGAWQYNTNNDTIDDYFRYGVQRAKPYARNSLWTMAMRGTGDTAIEGDLGIDAIVDMLETLVDNQRQILVDGLGIDHPSDVPSLWCLYKEVQSYQERGLVVPEDITLLWADDNWGNIRRLPLANETDRSGGAGVYYHFDYVGGPRDYKWINTIQLDKTAEQMHLAYERHARDIWIVNVGDIKPKEIPINHFLDMAYDAELYNVHSTPQWLADWTRREFGPDHVDHVVDIMIRYGMYAARRKYELLEPHVYSVINYREADAVLAQWARLADDTQAVYDALDEDHQPAFFQMVLHPVLAGEIVHKIQINGARNQLYANQKRNAANDVIWDSLQLMYDDSNLTQRWNDMLDGKWAHMLDQTHLGYDYWQQPMRNTLPDMRFVQDVFPSLGGEWGVTVEGSNASAQGDSQWHPLSTNDLFLLPLDPWGAVDRYIEVFHRGPNPCNWFARPQEDYINLSVYNGSVGGDNGSDTRIFVSVDWEKAPAAPSTSEVYIDFTSDCRGFEQYAGDEPRVVVTVENRLLPDNFTEGFVESDGHVAIEALHYQSVYPAQNKTGDDHGHDDHHDHLPPNATALVRRHDGHHHHGDGPEYHLFPNYGRTHSGVGLFPLNTEKLELGEGPALEYSLYLFTNHSAANVTLYISPAANYLGDGNPLEYAVVLFPTGEEQPEPDRVQPIGPNVGGNMPVGWDGAVADSVWGLTGGYTTSTFEVPRAGAYTLRIWALMPNLVVQKIVVDLGGVRKSYLGPPESFLVGRDKRGEYDGTSFASTPGIVGALSANDTRGVVEESGAGGSSMGLGLAFLPLVLGFFMTL
ncbi:glycoside hydrolase family 115 protein [Sodiomyces alcalophilus JCM 7366]|uniref:glycoside hydrolase family 115 protein n=1 Tax=Sodiomyces alcalophilus JCM 7366 TaxID=591952 RepID=UPI0039B555C7